MIPIIVRVAYSESSELCAYWLKIGVIWLQAMYLFTAVLAEQAIHEADPYLQASLRAFVAVAALGLDAEHRQ